MKQVLSIPANMFLMIVQEWTARYPDQARKLAWVRHWVKKEYLANTEFWAKYGGKGKVTERAAFVEGAAMTLMVVELMDRLTPRPQGPRRRMSSSSATGTERRHSVLT